MGTGELTPAGTSEAAKFIRKAISHAVNRDIIVSEIFDGLVAPGTSPIADACVGYNDSMVPYTYDLELAIDLLEQDGYDIRITTPLTKTSFIVLLSMIIGLTSISKMRRKREN